MNLETKVLHFTLTEEEREYLNRKIERVRQAEASLIDFLLTLSKEKADYSAEATVNFKWGGQAHVKERASDFDVAVDKLVDSLSAKIIKEKEKKQQARQAAPVY